jgi:hypothetical protein
MKSVTLRDIPPRLARAIEARARRDGNSASQGVLRILKEAVPQSLPKRKQARLSRSGGLVRLLEQARSGKFRTLPGRAEENRLEMWR